MEIRVELSKAEERYIRRMLEAGIYGRTPADILRRAMDEKIEKVFFEGKTERGSNVGR